MNFKVIIIGVYFLNNDSIKYLTKISDILKYHFQRLNLYVSILKIKLHAVRFFQLGSSNFNFEILLNARTMKSLGF